MTWWMGVLLGWAVLLVGAIGYAVTRRDPQDDADHDEMANLIRYELAKHPEIKREMLG